jgi:catechol 2,3-dioxygenase-like lactoylglutathione lyase family enzyme
MLDHVGIEVGDLDRSKAFSARRPSKGRTRIAG